MSRAFVKDDAPEAPPIIPPRAPLPPGVPNYVTPRGLARLRAEREELETERARVHALPPDAPERQRDLAVLAGRLAALDERIASARPVDPAEQPPDEVRFGATVGLRPTGGGPERRYTIVGVDETSVAEGRIPFTAPVARALVGRRAGETARLRTPRGEETVEIVSIAYGDAAE